MKCGLLGKSLKHSYSKLIHEGFGLYDYELFQVDEQGLDDFFKRKDWQGINVTIPYKKRVLSFCDLLSPVARDIGSVNTIVRLKDGRLYGHNTDYDGFLYMASRKGISFKGKEVVVLGSGGASACVTYAVRQGGGSAVVVSRAGAVTYENVTEESSAAILVNTTPVGMYPHTEECPIDLSRLPNVKAVMDLVYNPYNTRLLQQAAQRGLLYEGGLSMLAAQAVYASRLFISPEPHREYEAPDIETIEDTLKKIKARTLNIVLVGMPGSGKSTLGKKLAERLKREFVDTDALVERMAGLSIQQLFREKGEQEFRRLERLAAAEAGMRSSLVIATGGGIVLDRENYKSLKQNATIIHIVRSVDKLATDGRPLSKTPEELEKLFRERVSLYKSFADFTADNNGSLQRTIHQIEEHLSI